MPIRSSILQKGDKYDYGAVLIQGHDSLHAMTSYSLSVDGCWCRDPRVDRSHITHLLARWLLLLTWMIWQWASLA